MIILLDATACHETASFMNTDVSSYNWVHWNGVSCEDTHQCFIHSSCGLNEKGLNTDGSIIYECNTGYILNK